MSERIDYQKIAPKATKGLVEIEKYIYESDLDPALYELVKLRASQMNGCAFCVDMHTKDARANGETEQRLYAINVAGNLILFKERTSGIGMDRSPRVCYEIK